MLGNTNYLETENHIIQGLAVCEKSSYVTDRNQKNVLATDTHITFIYPAAMRIVYVSKCIRPSTSVLTRKKKLKSIFYTYE